MPELRSRVSREYIGGELHNVVDVIRPVMK